MSVSFIPAALVNESMSVSANVIIPEVGMLGTMFVGSDRYAVVVTKVFTNKKIQIDWIHSDEVISQKFVKDGIEYVPADAAAALIDKYTPDHDKFMTKHKGEWPDEELEKWFGFELEHFMSDKIYTFRKNGRWVKAGDGLWDCTGIHLGVADEYRDPCF